MTDHSPPTGISREVRAKDAVEALRSNLSNAEIAKRFKISAQGFADLVRQLFETGLITEQDLVSRGLRFRVVRKESVVAPPKLPELTPMEESEIFLDTVVLTALLSSKEFRGQPASKAVQPAPAKQEQEASSRKPTTRMRRSPFGSLFKKGR